VKAVSMLTYLCDRFACCLAEPDHMPRIFGGVGCLRVRIWCVSDGRYWLALQRAHTFPLCMRICPAMIVLQHSKSHVKNDWFAKAVSMLTCAIASRAVLLNLITCDEYFAVSDVCAYVSDVFQLVRIDRLYSSLTRFRCECDFAQPWLYYSIRNRTWHIIDLWRLYRCLLNCAIGSRAVLLNFITWYQYLAESDVRAYAHLLSLRWYVFIYYTARSHFSVKNATLPSLDCITAIEIALERWLLCEGCIRAYLCYRFARCVAGPDQMPRIFCAIGHLVGLFSDFFQLVRIDFLHSPLTLLCGGCELAQSWLYYTIPKLHLKYDWFVKAASMLICFIASRAVLLDLIKCHQYMAVTDICSYAHLMSFS